jgi:hypothetical protein
VNAYGPIETISSRQDGATVTYPAHIPVRAGEEIALDVYGFAGAYGCSYGGSSSDLVDMADDGQGGTHDFGHNAYWDDSRVNVLATLATGSHTSHHRRRHRRHRHHRSV